MASTKVPSPRAPGRRWPLAEKRRIVELTLRAGASIQAIAQEQGIHPTSLSHWRTLYRAGKLDMPPTSPVRDSMARATFLPVSIAPAVREPQPTPRHRGTCSGDVLHLTLVSGATLRIETGALDAGVLCALVAELQR